MYTKTTKMIENMFTFDATESCNTDGIIDREWDMPSLFTG